MALVTALACVQCAGDTSRHPVVAGDTFHHAHVCMQWYLTPLMY